MPRYLKDRKISTLILIVLVGLLIGSFLTELLSLLPGGEHNVVRTIFTKNVPIRLGSFEESGFDTWLLNLGALKCQFAVELKVNLLSLIGMVTSLSIFSNFK
ncbi:MAG: DUF4321 domain-containing protein [Fibrobacterota bacterium]